MDSTQSLGLLNMLHPKLRAIAIQCYNEAVAATPTGVHPYIVASYRSFAESAVLYAQGRTTPGDIVTEALPGTSWHNWGLAIDFGLLYNGEPKFYGKDPDVNANWMIVVNIFEKQGFNWGHYFPGLEDDPHLECKMGQTINGLLAQYHAGNFISGTNYINF